jgi:peptidoglycan/xylan/chitin deacetylase (PgdA/CDA1 family)
MTFRLRSTLARTAARLRGNTVAPAILMYHRVAEVSSDPWGLAVSPSIFDRHMSIVARERTVMPLTAMVEALIARRVPADAIGISFDDGYSDNLHVALPLLEKYDLPATFFVTTDPVKTSRPFWWDELAAMTLEYPHPLNLKLETLSQFHVVLGPRERGDADRGWRAWTPGQTARQRLYVELWSRLKAAPIAQRNQVMEELSSQIEHIGTSSNAGPLSPAELQRLASHPRASIGGHTTSHADLSKLPAEAQRDEILQGKAWLEGITGRSIDGFAYPHGLYGGESANIVRDCGFLWACTTAGSRMPLEVDRYHLPRLTIGNLAPGAFRSQLSTR